MAVLEDIINERLKTELVEFVEDGGERQEMIALYARTATEMQDIAASIVDGQHKVTDPLTTEALAAGVDALTIMDDGLIAGMGLVGIKFRDNFIFVPEVLACARAMKAGMKHIEPILSASGVEPIGKVIMGTVKGDLHDIGKNLVCMMAEGAGFTMINLGVDTSADDFLQAVKENNARIVGMSALLTTTMPYMKTVIDTFKLEGLDEVVMCIGGAPVSEMFAEEIGADGYAADASSAVDLFKELYPAAAGA